MTMRITHPTEAPPVRTPARHRLGLTDPATYRLSLRLIADLVIGTLTFSVMVSLLAASAGLLVTLAGIPLLLGTLLVARGIGVVERARARVPRPTAEAPIRRSGRLQDRLRDRDDWRAVLYAILLFPAGVLTGTVTLAGWATAFAALTSPFYVRWVSDPPHLAGISLESPVGVTATVLSGVVLLLAMPAVVRTLGRLDGLLIRRFLA